MKFNEIRNSHYDENEGCYCIDAWRTSSQGEEGFVAAKVYLDRIVYNKSEYENVPEIQEKVAEAMEKIKQHSDKLGKVFYKNGDMCVPTKDGYIRISPVNNEEYPRIYIDLVSDNISEENKGAISKNEIRLAMVESRESKEYHEISGYYTQVYENMMNDEFTWGCKHNIVFKNADKK